MVFGMHSNISCFSNWFPTEFDYAGRHFMNAEQFMMFHKVMMFKKYDLADQIMKTQDPAACKKIAGQKFPEFRADIWEQVCRAIVKRGVKAKFSQNTSIMETLLSTGEALLAECSPYDKIWGIGIDIADPKRFNCTKWNGSNYLGRILMEVREELRIEVLLRPSGKIDYVDARDLPDIQEWNMQVNELKRIPKYYSAIHTYADTLPTASQRAFFLNSGTFANWEDTMRTNMGGGLPVEGFYEMKQEIYDIARISKLLNGRRMSKYVC